MFAVLDETAPAILRPPSTSHWKALLVFNVELSFHLKPGRSNRHDGNELEILEPFFLRGCLGFLLCNQAA